MPCSWERISSRGLLGPMAQTWERHRRGIYLFSLVGPITRHPVPSLSFITSSHLTEVRDNKEPGPRTLSGILGLQRWHSSCCSGVPAPYVQFLSPIHTIIHFTVGWAVLTITHLPHRDGLQTTYRYNQLFSSVVLLSTMLMEVKSPILSKSALN